MIVIMALNFQVKNLEAYVTDRLRRGQKQWKLKSDVTFKKDNDDDTMFPKIDAAEEIQKVAKYIPYVKIDVPLDKKNYKGKRKYDNGPKKHFQCPNWGPK